MENHAPYKVPRIFQSTAVKNIYYRNFNIWNNQVSAYIKILGVVLIILFFLPTHGSSIILRHSAPSIRTIISNEDL
jgi:hypothetical protein